MTGVITVYITKNDIEFAFVLCLRLLTNLQKHFLAKVKIGSTHIIKTSGYSGGITSPILNLGSGWSSVVSLALRPPQSQGKRPYNQLNRTLNVHQSRSGHYGEGINLSLLPGFESLIVQPIFQSLYCGTAVKYAGLAVFSFYYPQPVQCLVLEYKGQVQKFIAINCSTNITLQYYPFYNSSSSKILIFPVRQGRRMN